MNRLREEFVGPGLDASDPIGKVGLSRDQYDRRQPSRGIGLEPATDFQAIEPWHGDVEKNDVRMVLVNGIERGGPVRRTDDVVAVGQQQLSEQRPDAFSVVSDEHPAPPLHLCYRLVHDTRPKGTNRPVFDSLY